MTATRQTNSFVAGLAIAAILLLGWMVYLPAGGGVFLLLFGGIDARGRALDEVHDFYVGFNAWQAEVPGERQ